MTSLTLQMKIAILDTIREEISDTAYALAEGRSNIIGDEDFDNAFDEIFADLVQQTLVEIKNEFGGIKMQKEG